MLEEKFCEKCLECEPVMHLIMADSESIGICLICDKKLELK